MSTAIFEDAGPADFCIETWRSRDKDGYGGAGLVRFGKTIRRAHQVAWIDAHGHLPEGHVLHACDNPPCVRPDHLFVGTNHDNVIDMISKGRGRNQVKTHCPKGHAYTPENTYLYGTNRQCKACKSNKRS